MSQQVQLPPTATKPVQRELDPELTASTKEPIRKELMQCQFCYRSRLSGGASLSKCGGCKIALYCSKECQKSAWPLHKEKCKVNQRVLAMPPAQSEGMKALRAFTTKHRPTLSEFGKRALDLYENPSNSERYVLAISVEPRQHSKRIETSFVVVDITIETPDFFGEHADGIRGQIKFVHDENERVGGKGGFMAVLIDNKTLVNNVVGIGFTEDFENIDPSVTWKEAMMKRMNNGIVI